MDHSIDIAPEQSPRKDVFHLEVQTPLPTNLRSDLASLTPQPIFTRPKQNTDTSCCSELTHFSDLSNKPCDSPFNQRKSLTRQESLLDNYRKARLSIGQRFKKQLFGISSDSQYFGSYDEGSDTKSEGSGDSVSARIKSVTMLKLINTLVHHMNVLLMAIISVFGIIWTLVYVYFGQIVTSLFPLTFSTLSLIFGVMRHFKPKYDQATSILFTTTILILPVGVHASLGGFEGSSMVIMWCLIAPSTAFMLHRSTKMFYAYTTLFFFIVLFLAIAEFWGNGSEWNPLQPTVHPTSSMIAVFYVMNLIGSMSVIQLSLLVYFLKYSQEKHLSNHLLKSMLPTSLIPRVMNTTEPIADYHACCSVLFADIVGFTQYSRGVPPQKIVASLNLMFHEFDSIIARNSSVEKIKTIGDAIMIASGVPTFCEDHALKIARVSFDILSKYHSIRPCGRCDLRIGVNCGPLVAGIIGHDKIAYDLWGNTVNTASRMESTGESGKIHISHTFLCELIKEAKLKSGFKSHIVEGCAANDCDVSDGEKYLAPLGFTVTTRGEISVKGQGEMTTYWLSSCKKKVVHTSHVSVPLPGKVDDSK